MQPALQSDEKTKPNGPIIGTSHCALAIVGILVLMGHLQNPLDAD